MRPACFWPSGNLSDAFSQEWQACLVEPLDSASVGLMEET
jgi:hypothetical protein